MAPPNEKALQGCNGGKHLNKGSKASGIQRVVAVILAINSHDSAPTKINLA